MVAEQVRKAATTEFDDLRGLPGPVEADGELRRFNKVDWHLEIGGINEAMRPAPRPDLPVRRDQGLPRRLSGLQQPVHLVSPHRPDPAPPESTSQGVDLLNAYRQKIRSITPIPPVTAPPGRSSRT